MNEFFEQSDKNGEMAVFRVLQRMPCDICSGHAEINLSF